MTSIWLWSLLVISVDSSFDCFARNRRSKLLVVVIDGVRWDYPYEEPGYPGFANLVAHGVRAPYVIPVFPPYAYPNWYSLLTGLYPEVHEMVMNTMYDPYYNEIFHYAPHKSSAKRFWWDSAEPIWNTAEKRGMRSAIFRLDGCQVKIRGRIPSFCEKYSYVKHNETVHALKATLRLFEKDELDLAFVYHEEVDKQGHIHGPASPERKLALKNIDILLDYYQRQIYQRGLENKLNMIVVSDHGMIDTFPRDTKIIDISSAINTSIIRHMMNHGAMSMVQPKKGQIDMVYDALKSIDGMRVYKKDDIPERFHLKKTRRTLPILLIAKKGYFIKNIDKEADDPEPLQKGTHGYDPKEVHEMRTIFFARGPCFKKRFKSLPLSIVDVYNVFCDVIGIPALPNNGSRARTNPMLTKRCSKCLDRKNLMR